MNASIGIVLSIVILAIVILLVFYHPVIRGLVTVAASEPFESWDVLPPEYLDVTRPDIFGNNIVQPSINAPSAITQSPVTRDTPREFAINNYNPHRYAGAGYGVADIGIVGSYTPGPIMLQPRQPQLQLQPQLLQLPPGVQLEYKSKVSLPTTAHNVENDAGANDPISEAPKYSTHGRSGTDARARKISETVDKISGAWGSGQTITQNAFVDSPVPEPAPVVAAAVTPMESVRGDAREHMRGDRMPNTDHAFQYKVIIDQPGRQTVATTLKASGGIAGTLSA
jgi:hypothetical protein